MKKKKIRFLVSGQKKRILIFFLSGQTTLRLENQLLKLIKLVGQNIKTVGLVAGFKDFQADICLSEIGFY